MRSLLVMSFAAVVAAGSPVAALAGSSHGANQLAQNTGAADRSLGNGSMGTGEGVERLPEQRDEDRDVRDSRTSKTYDESGHGDTHPDMEHRPRRTLGDRDDD